MFKSIKTRLIVVFLLLALIPLLLLRVVVYPRAIEALKAETEKHLKNAGVKQAALVRMWMRERLKDVKVTAKNPLVTSGPGITPSDKEFLLLSSFLNIIKESYGYKEIVVTDIKGEVTISTSKHKWGANIFDTSGFQRAIGGHTVISKVFPHGELDADKDEAPHMFFSSPVTSGNKVIGVLIFEMELKGINDLMKNVLLGGSGETYIIDEKGMAMTELRHLARGRGSIGYQIVDPDTDAPTLASRECMKGGEGFDVRGYRNYAGNEVFGFWQWIPEFKLGVIAEMSKKEALGVAYSVEAMMESTQLLLGFFVVFGAFLLGRKISTPILNLTDLTRKMAGGDLSQKADISTGDEIGELAQSFNRMVTSIRDKTEELEETTNFLNSILSGSSEYAIIALDLTGRIQAFNEGARRVFGYEPEEVIDKLDVGALVERDAAGGDIPEDALSITGKTGRFDGDVVGKRKSGEVFPVHITLTVRKSEQGRATGFVAIARDITDEKAMEKEIQNHTSALERMVEERTQALKATEERYLSLFDSTKDAAFICDTENRFRDINQAGLELFGYDSKESILNKNFVNTFCVNSGDGDTFHRNMTEAGFIKDFELELKRKNGDKITAIMTCSLRKDKEAKIVGYEGIIRDVTEKKKREREKDVITNINRVIASSLELKDVYKAISAELDKLIRFDRTSITLLLEDDSVKEYIVYTKDSSASRLSEGTTFPRKGSTTEAVVQSGRPIIIHDTAKGEFVTDSILHSEGIRSRLNFPLEYKGKIIGTINFGSKKERNFSEEHVELLQQIAPQLAVAIENSNLFSRIRDSEEKYRDLIENAPEMIHKVDSLGRFLTVNKTELERLGYTLGEMRNMSLHDIVPEEFRKDLSGHLKSVIDTGHDLAECVFVTKDGKRMIVEMDSTGVCSPLTGDFIHARSFVRDITDRKKREEEILRLAHTLRSIGECVVIADKGGHVSFVNKSFEKVVGYGLKEMGGQELSILAADNSPVNVKEVLKKTFSQGDWEGELLFKNSDEEEFPVYLFASLIHDEDNKPLALAVVFRNISEHKRLQMELFQSEKMASMGQFAAGVAHEIRNPLSVIGSSIYYLNDILPGRDKKVKEHLKMIQDEVGRCQRIINQLLDFSKKAKVEVEKCDINKLIENTLSLVGKELLENNIKVVGDFAPVPLLKLNTDDFKQVLLNLILNARDAMPKGGTLRIATGSNPEGSVYLVVSDTGVGIPKNELERIFLPFYTSKETGSGTGLGLYSVHSAIKRANGSINVSSQKGKGSSFTITLPLAKGSRKKAGGDRKRWKTGSRSS
ncbi:MAG: PAS domain S-box protein [Candidatus Bathyanammoxibius sp.]